MVMIISHQYKFIYIRVPKTGSTSIEKFLLQIDPNAECSNNDEIPYGHYTAKQLREMVGNEVYDEYFVFTFMREPGGWFLSQYADHARLYYTKFKQMYILLDEERQLHIPDGGVLEVDNVLKCYGLLKWWFGGATQCNYLNDRVDFIGKFEELESEMRKICEKLGITSEVELPRLNQSLSHTLSYSPRAKELVNVLLQDDITLYYSK